MYFFRPYFDVFFLLDIRRRNRRSRGKRKNGNLKRKHKNKTFWTLTDFWKILKSGRHQMLSKLSSLSIASLRKLDEEANKFYDRKHDLYHTALLTRCYTQHALRPYIDSEMNHIGHFIKIPFINKGIDFIDLPSIVRDNTVDHLFLIILKIRNHLLFVIDIINLLEVHYSISINWLLILILILRHQIHEIVKFQNSVMNQQAILLQEI